MYNIIFTNKFKKDYKLLLRRGYNEVLIKRVISILVNKQMLTLKYKPHKLIGDYADCWECHLNPDWLLIWQINEETNSLVLIRTGTHSDLF